MKIIVPTISMVQVGWGTTTDRIYYCPTRPNHYGKEFAIREPQLGTKVIFDRDLQIARRTTAVGRTAALVVAGIAFAPVYAAYTVGEYVGRAMEEVALRLEAGLSALGVLPGSGFWNTLRTNAKEIVR